MDRMVTSSQQITVQSVGGVNPDKQNLYKLDIVGIAFKGQENNRVDCWLRSKNEALLVRVKKLIEGQLIDKTWDEVLRFDYGDSI